MSSLTDRLTKALEAEAGEMSFACLAIMRIDGFMIASTADRSCARNALRGWNGDAPNATLIEDDGPPIRWIVASRSTSTHSSTPVIVASAQPAASHESLLDAAMPRWILGIGTPLLLAIGLSIPFVSAAQAQIDTRTRALSEARASVASFVSHSTRKRALASSSKARRIEATLLYLDVRDFSSFAERSTPDEAAELISKVAEIAFRAVDAAGGDADRLVGDGLLAWFEESLRRESGWKASAAILETLAKANSPGGVGIGLHDGEVVEAEIGKDIRRDIIGKRSQRPRPTVQSCWARRNSRIR